MKAQLGIPNAITLTRLCLCPVLVILFVYDLYWEALVVYALQEVLDQVDGKLAHRLGMQTAVGTLFDPFADSITHLTAFSCLFSAGLVPLWILLVFIYREFGLIFLRLLAALQGTVLGGHWPGKTKAFVHAAVIIISLVSLATGTSTHLLSAYHWMLIAALASILSGIFYIVHYSSILRRAFS